MLQRFDDEEDKCREEENENGECGEDNENIEEDYMGGEEDKSGEGDNEDEMEFVRRQTRRSHVVVPPIVPAREGEGF
jgi:hypothetical protein